MGCEQTAKIRHEKQLLLTCNSELPCLDDQPLETLSCLLSQRATREQNIRHLTSALAGAVCLRSYGWKIFSDKFLGSKSIRSLSKCIQHHLPINTTRSRRLIRNDACPRTLSHSRRTFRTHLFACHFFKRTTF